MRHYAVIVAGGSGSRMGGKVPKQFQSLCGRPVLWWSMKAFHDENPETNLIIVLPEQFISFWEDLWLNLPREERFEHLVISGGHTRTESVVKGLSLIKEDDSLVAVHDGARPLVHTRTIKEGWNLASCKGAAVPVVPVTDSLREITGDASINVDRSKFVAVQTPQVFKTLLLKESYEKIQGKVFSDDASVVENFGHEVAIFEGSHSNMKVTNPEDLLIASVLMGHNA